MRFTLYSSDTKHYSSWSMRPWVLMREVGIVFKEEILTQSFLVETGSLEQAVLENAQTDKIPVLVDHDVQGGLLIWDTLSICEYLAEQFPEEQLWPSDGATRAQARSVCIQMHSGFQALRTYFPVNIETTLPQIGKLILQDHGSVVEDIQRLTMLWRRLLDRSGGPMLFGHFSVADIFSIPICLRFRTYGVPVAKELDDYTDCLCQLPSVRQWIKESVCLEEDFYSFDGLH